MKINANTSINGKKIVMIPYEKKHVPRYHEWMKSPELQELTASEPLSLEEEYAMQESWRNDEKKCTFIILKKEDFQRRDDSEIDSMIGDVNLFFNDDDDSSTAEIEIMIAELSARGKGLGKEAVYSMIRYGIETLNMKTFTAKIGYSNQPSINMFKKIGFIEISRTDVFKEVTLELKVTPELKNRVDLETESYEVKHYQTTETNG